MLKIYLVSILPVQPLSFSFSTSAFQFQPFFFSGSTLQRLSFLLFFYFFSLIFFFFGSAPLSFFLFQHFSVSTPLLLFFSSSAPLSFLSQFMCCPFFSLFSFISQPKTFFSSTQNISLLLLHVSLFE